MRYPFVIKNKSVTVEAKTYDNALNRVLYRNPNKFITTTFAKNVAKHQKTMDLINSQKEAKKLSRENKGVLFHVILENDEFLVKKFDEVKPKDDVYSTWRDGAKHEDLKEEETITNNKMETKTKSPVKKAPKKIAKKTPAKKVVKKETNGEAKLPRGNNMFLTAAEWKKVDAILAKEETTFSAWSRSLVQSKIK